MVALTIQGLSHRYATRPILHNFELAANAGSVVSILGPSGCGKTTLLRLIAGLEPIQTGTILHAAQRRAFVFQEPRLLPWKSTLDNLRIPLEAAGWAPSQAQQEAQDWLQRLELHKSAGLFPRQLSGGMQRRVALGRALAVQPDLLLLDEPLTGLDEALRHRMLDLIAHTQSALHATMLYVTHQRRDIQRWQGSVVEMRPLP
jgi:NitT/TauT family transport system ATP-binding protein